MSADRPRDSLGRPVPVDSPLVDATPVPDVTHCSDGEAWQIAADLMAAGRPFHAHEVCEERWRMSTGPDRTMWRALAQWGAAETHRARGNPVGAQRLAERALAGLQACERTPAGVDIDAVLQRCRMLKIL